ncbi:hypothetical protein [Paenibacillus glycanilyticus]|uniref:hypothetical protein n=1 Tax=Paenibacillus glycanilyticus TaxID=126569 RepID=UPI00191009CA|nr:hypothetical protein [Paenibacillus glycanilyticus]
MNIFSFKTSKLSEEYCDEIISIMTKEFNISKEEAIGRINDQWEGLDWNDDINKDDYDIRYHELPEDWAYIIYFGHESQWWKKNKEDLIPKPYPKK